MSIWKTSVDRCVEILKKHYGIEVSIEPSNIDLDDIWEIRVNGAYVCLCRADYYEAHIALEAIYGTMSYVRAADALKE